MASNYSALKIELIGTGEQAGTWGDTTNVNLGENGAGLEQAIVGMATLVTGDFTSNSYTLPYTNTNAVQDFRALVLNITATLSAAGEVIVPAIQKPYIILNNSVGGYAVTVKVTGQTGVSVPNGAKILVYNNGTDVGPAITHLTALTLASALPVASGGTGAATLTSNNVLLGNGTSSVQFVAPGSSGNVLTSNGTTWTSAAPAVQGDVTGPASSTDNAIVRFDSTTGKLIQDSSGATITDSWNLGLGIAPTSKIHIYEASTAPSIQLENGNTAPVTGTDLGTVNFISNDSSTNANGARVSLVGEVTNTTGNGRFTVLTKPSSSLSNITALSVSADSFLYPSGVNFGDSYSNDVFGSLIQSSSDTTSDIDLSGYFSASIGVFAYMSAVVVGVYDASPTTARLWKVWQQGVYYDGTNFTLPGAALIGAAYNSDATNFPAGAVNAVKVQTIVSGSTVTLRLTNRTTPAGGSFTYWSYRIQIRRTF